MADELPVLMAAVAGERARELEEASRVGGQVWVPLKRPPGRRGPHMLEVFTPGVDEPLRLLAEPLGMSSDAGFAIRVYPWEEDEVETAHPLPDVSPDQLVGRTLAGGRFEILSLIGEGSVGAVYRARHTGLGIVVAVKVLHEAFQRDIEFSRRFYAEALALSRLDHPNLIHIHDFGQDRDGLLYISMAFVDGRTLRSVLTRDARISDTKRAVALMVQVCAGLGHAHARGLIHRDVKPDNVMIVTREDDDGNIVENVKVLDFGFAVPPNISGEVAQRLAGTPVYMSPEQCLGEELDARSDVYACGIMLYELITGTVPFLADDTESIRHKQINELPPPMSTKAPNVDPRLDRLVRKALSKSREDRHPSMQDLRGELKTLLLPEGTPTNSLRTTGSYERASTPSIHSIPVMQRKSVPAPAADWLEGSAESYGRLMEEARIAAPAYAIADVLSTDSSSWLGELAQERDPHAFAMRLAALDGAVRILAERADVWTLQRVSAVVQGLEQRADELEESAEVRAALASVARLFADPAILAPIARRLLAQEEAREVAAGLIADARVAGAFALYGARTKTNVDQRARIAFVTTMKALGEVAMPVVRAALERIHEATMSGQHRGAAELAEDLLLCVPPSLDEVAGHLIVKYIACPSANVCRAAARALPRVWGQRAKPTLLELVHHEDDGVCIAALVGVREIDCIDTEAVRHVAAMFDGRRVRGQQVRAAAVAALRAATAPARSDAAALIERLQLQR